MRAPSSNSITLQFGSADPPYSEANRHKGTDFAHLPDNIIYAPCSGKVTQVPNNGADGNGTYMYDPQGRFHGMLHASRYLVPNGAQVSEGQQIAVMGDTGNAQGVHLHWCVKENNVFINPLSLLGGGKGADPVMSDIVENTDAQYQRYSRLHRQVVGYNPTREHFAAFAVGQDTTRVIDIISGAPGADQRTRAGDVGAVAIAENWQGQIADLLAASQAVSNNPTKQQFDEFQAKLKACSENLTISQDKLLAAQKQQADDTETGNRLVRAITLLAKKYIPGI